MEEKKNYRVGQGCLVKRSTIGENTVIEDDCVVLNSTIGAHVDIEKRNLIRKATKIIR